MIQLFHLILYYFHSKNYYKQIINATFIPGAVNASFHEDSFYNSPILQHFHLILYYFHSKNYYKQILNATFIPGAAEPRAFRKRTGSSTLELIELNFLFAFSTDSLLFSL